MNIDVRILMYVCIFLIFWWLFLGGREQFSPYPDSFKNYGVNAWHRYWSENNKNNISSGEISNKFDKYLDPVSIPNKEELCTECYYPFPMPDHSVYKTDR